MQNKIFKPYKIIIAIFFAVMLLIALCSCGENNFSQEGNTSGNAASVPASVPASNTGGSSEVQIPKFEDEEIQQTVTIKADASGKALSAKLKTSGEDMEEDVPVSELPFAVKVTYFLDDKEVSASEIAGATGNVRIRFDYENKSKVTVKVDDEDVETIVPFAFISMAALPDDRFYNVKVDGGSVSSMSGNRITMGYAMPGLSEKLGIDKDEDEEDRFKDYVEISAYAVNFKLDFTATMVNNGLFAKAEDDDMDKIAEILFLFGQVGVMSYEDAPKTVKNLKAMRLADQGFTAWNTYDGGSGSISFILETAEIK